MNIRFLETFVLLARIGSVRRVAELVHASPGAVSMRIRGLESDLGVTLFHWDRKTLQITDAGARLLRHAEAVIEATRTLERAARSDDAIGCRLRVGVLETAVHTFLPEFVKAMGASLPHIELDLTVDLSTHLSEQMMRRDLDLIVRTGSGVDPQFAVVENLLEVPVHWIARRGLVPRKDGLHKALGKQLLTQMRGTGPYEQAVAMAQQLAVQSGMVSSDLRISGSPSLAALVSLVREGLGVAIMHGMLVAPQLASGELVELELPTPPSFRITTWYPKSPPPGVTDTAQVLRRVCKSYCKRVSPHLARYIG